MASIPRVVTVDPTGEISEIVRVIFNLMERTITHIDVATGPQAGQTV